MAGAKPAVHVCQLKPISVPESLIKGNKFIKWDDSSTIGVPVTLKVDQKGYILYWRDQNKDMDYLDISLIRDTRTGRYAKIPKEGKLRDSCTIGSSDIQLEDKTVSICYGTDMVNIDWINFVCASREVAMELCDELLKYAYNLLAQNGSVLTFLEKAYTRLTCVLDVNGKIPVKNIIKVVTTSNKDDKSRVVKALESAGFQATKNDTIDPNGFTFDDFFNFYRHLCGRTEVDKVFEEIGAKKKPYLTAEQFVQFLNKEQRDPRLNEILYPYYTLKQATELIETYETKSAMAAKGHFSQEGFLKFLMCEVNNVIPPDKLDLSHDMTHPLSHYFINSSHNTYLTGHQLTGKSVVEMYRQCLLSGCRCIELDCWDGKGADEEPIITHGYTMCTEISYKEVIEAIAESAFKTSDYPVILSFENHCSSKQQAKMATYCRNIFGDMLLTDSLDGYPLEPNVPLPSPELLKRKIIVKNKKKHFHKAKEKVTSPKSSKMKTDSVGDSEEAGGNEEQPEKRLEKHESIDDKMEPDDSDDCDTSDEEDLSGLSEEEEKLRQREKREKGTAGSEAEAGMEMSELVNYVQPVHFHSFDASEKKNKSYEITSFVETQATALLKVYPVDFVNYNKRQLSRIYPRGTRVDSSNFMPQMFWNAGCQLVALNFQTLDLAMQLNLGIFEYNNRSGYILKPDFMRRKDRHFDPFAESTVDGIIAGTVRIRVISGHLLSDKRVGTYVEVDMYGLPTDTVRKRFRTRTVPNNGISPVYDEPPFVFKKVVLPTLAVIRLAVYEETGKLIGHRVLPVEGLRPGYRHICLRNESNQPLLLPALFVHIQVKDYVPDAFAEFADALANPQAYISQLEKHAQQLAIYEDNPNYKENEEVSPLKQDGKESGRRPSNISPYKPRNGSISDDGGMVLTRNPSYSRSPLGTKVSTTSDTSTGSGSGPGMVSRMQSTDNGYLTTSVVSTTKLNDPALLIPTPLSKLKEEKPYLKALSKREKDLDIIRKKHEKARESTKELHELQEEKQTVSHMKERTSLEKQHMKSVKKASKHGKDSETVQNKNTDEFKKLVQDQEEKNKALRKSQAEVFVAMCKDQFQMEFDICLKHIKPLQDALRQVMEASHEKHRKQLQSIHDQEVKELTKRMDTQSQEEMSQAKYKNDKQAYSRIKREIQKKHIEIVVSERQKLQDILDSKKEELEKRLKTIKDEFENECIEDEQKHRDVFSEKCQQITKQYKDLLEMSITSSFHSSIEHLNGAEIEESTAL
ncbi:hypothetical protein ACJMK2_038024 [Sinanodonta woodiana]|uniref:1-phosphatidylinositol 4,5-bisphosphate phosphodiesterase n=1 Tax=Sinanodonta woodiana TaxID=1069815 RepID=A0ABD3WM84_SINWO